MGDEFKGNHRHHHHPKKHQGFELLAFCCNFGIHKVLLLFVEFVCTVERFTVSYF